jgi:lipopolysaccharide transport system permease protein
MEAIALPEAPRVRDSARRHPLASAVPPPHVGTLVANVWRDRELLWHLTVRNLRSQYKQSILGYAWILVNPAVQLLTLTFIFSTVLRTPSQGVPFPLFLCVGLIPWLFFATAVMAATDSVSGSANFVTTVYFPREILPVSAVLMRVLDLAAGLAVVFGLLLYYGYGLGWTAGWLPLLCLGHFVLGLGLGLPLAALNLFFHDVRFLVATALNVWFFVTPVMYPPEIVPDRYRFLQTLNPNAWLIDAYRAALLDGKSPSAEILLWTAGTSLVVLAAGYWTFKRLEPGFADSI